jgi:hypothetical protein
MVQVPQRTTVRGPTFIRLLARLANADALPSSPSLSDRLSQWLDWNHAVALSTALDRRPPATATDASAPGGGDEAECARMRDALAQAIATAPELAVAASGEAGPLPAAESGAPAEADYAPFRQRYVALQRKMQAASGHLRGRLRDLLALGTADMARLAEVDAALELALSPREQILLAKVPALLGEHFERLRQAAAKAPADAPGTWLDVFRKDMQSVLLAELDVRFQPVEGLLAALRTR